MCKCCRCILAAIEHKLNLAERAASKRFAETGIVPHFAEVPISYREKNGEFGVKFTVISHDRLKIALWYRLDGEGYTYDPFAGFEYVYPDEMNDIILWNLPQVEGLVLKLSEFAREVLVLKEVPVIEEVMPIPIED